MKSRNLNLYLLAVLILMATVLLLDRRFLPARSPLSRFNPTDAELISTVMNLIKTDYLEEPNPVRIGEGAYRGLVNSLDPLSAYLDRDLGNRYLNQKAPVRDTGLVLYKKYGLFPVVVTVRENSPAAEAGLKVGDAISAINDRNTMNMSLLEVQLLLQADPKVSDPQPVKLRIVRGSDTLEKEIQRNFIFKESCSMTAGPSGLVIVHPSAIYEGASESISKQLRARLKTQPRPNAVVLDLRNCWLGSLEEARKIINLFIQDSEAAFIQARDRKQPLSCSDSPAFPEIKLFIWVNQATAGAAEVVAGVLKDLNRAKVIGLETPGLAGLQEIFPLSDGSLVVLTTAVYTLKSGTRLWENPVPLDAKLTYSEKIDQAFLEKTKEMLSSGN